MLFAAPRAQAGKENYCWNMLARKTYVFGFQNGDFSSLGQAQINAGAVQLTQSGMALTPEQIVLPYDQDVQVRLVYAKGGNSGTFGWFYLDQLAPFMSGGALVDADGDGIKDLFQWKKTGPPARLGDGLFVLAPALSTSIPALLLNSTSPAYSDGGTYPHIPNLIESTFPSAGGIAFALCDDDADLEVANTINSPLLPPIGDGKADIAGGDGIPDYDVNGDGVISEADRTVSLGTLSGNREIVFFYVAYGGDKTSPGSSFVVRSGFAGVTGGGTQSTSLLPFFTKSILNPDGYGNGYAAGQVVAQIDAGCPQGSSCITGGVSYPGWVDSAALGRLASATYGGVNLPQGTVKTVAATAGGQVPHVLSGAPKADPNRWILGFEDTPIVTGAVCPGCTVSDLSFDDAVFEIVRTSGGNGRSQLSSWELPVNQYDSLTISRLHLTATASFPAPCPTPPAGATLGAGTTTRVELSYSTNDGVTYLPASFPASADPTLGDSTIDLLATGVSGNRLRWQVRFVTDVEGCQPELLKLDVGYEAILGQATPYGSTEPVPAANVVVRSQWNAPYANWTLSGGDRSLRGYLNAHVLYDPDTGADLAVSGRSLDAWGQDAGTLLAARDPDGQSPRRIYWNNAGSQSELKTATGAPLFTALALDPGAKQNGALVYDYDASGVVDDGDAKWLVGWTRGYEDPVAKTLRAWKLGAILKSAPAVVGPPGGPWWLMGSGTPLVEKSAWSAFASGWSGRQTLALVGARDGMLHAFNLGHFLWGDDAATALIETRGYFAHGKGNDRDYGDGSEVWAFVPSSQVGKLKNHPERAAGWKAGENPRASTDAPVAVSDAYLGGAWKTVAVLGAGRGQPFITAVDVTTPPAVGSGPLPLWKSDWTDADFLGTEWSPSLAPVATPAGRVFSVAALSGLAVTPGDEYLFLVDAGTGQTIPGGKIKINGANSPATGYGTAASPAMVDSDGDGVVDRVYFADANGRLVKVSTKTETVCVLANLGESVYAPIAVSVSGDLPAKVKLFAGGADHPDLADTVGTYHLYAYEDDDAPGACAPALLLWSAPLTPAGANTKHKLWTAPVVTGDAVYVATAVGDINSICYDNPATSGVVEGWALTPDGNGGAVSMLAPRNLPAGNATGSLRAHDGHLFASVLDGTTMVLGGAAWNNGGATTPPSLFTPMWMER